MERALFITSAYVKEFTAIEKNVDDSIIIPYIHKTQKIKIENVLGSRLYKKLLDDVVAGSVTGDYKTLLENYVQPAMADEVFYQVMPHIWTRMTNKSASHDTDDTSTVIDLDTFKYLRDDIKNTAEYEMQLISDYLCAHLGQFPEYQQNSLPDEIRPTRENFSCGFYLGGGHCKSFYDKPHN